jgi:hypothetical protein
LINHPVPEPSSELSVSEDEPTRNEPKSSEEAGEERGL